MSTRTDLLLHPVRMRIVSALSGGRTLTTSELRDRMTGFGQATVYRQVARLVGAGVLEVDSEQRVRGATERRYRLRPERARISPRMAAAMSVEDHRRAFTAAMAALLAEFGTYLDQDGANPFTDGVGYRVFTLWLDRAERDEMLREVSGSLLRRMENRAGPGRTAYRMSPIVFPCEIATRSAARTRTKKG